MRPLLACRRPSCRAQIIDDDAQNLSEFRRMATRYRGVTFNIIDAAALAADGAVVDDSAQALVPLPLLAPTDASAAVLPTHAYTQSATAVGRYLKRIGRVQSLDAATALACAVRFVNDTWAQLWAAVPLGEPQAAQPYPLPSHSNRPKGDRKSPAGLCLWLCALWTSHHRRGRVPPRATRRCDTRARRWR